MKPILYRVETYIVPEVENLSIINGIDGLKIAKQFQERNKNENKSENNVQNEENASFILHNECEEFVKYSAENSKLIDLKIVKDIMHENETLHEYYDNDIVKHYNNDNFCPSKGRVQKMEFQASIGPQEALYPAKQFSRVNSLMSIDEKSENSLDTKLSDFCRHGYKNGCTASIPSPEEVSEEIFRENWLQKIEILRNRETILREKEINLQKRERELFRKEKELRITERKLIDKMKQADQQLKHQQNMLVEERLGQAARILAGDIEKSDNLSKEKILKKDVIKKENVSEKEEVPKKEEVPRKAEILKKEDVPKKEVPGKAEILKKEDVPKKEVPGKAEILKKEEVPKKKEVPKKEEVSKKVEIPKKIEIPKNPQPIINLCERREESNKKIHSVHSSSVSKKSSFSRTHSYATIKYKERPKINYDDLNSTLSGASVDIPNVRTSQWFNPTLYKKPHAFTRMASERCTRHKDTIGKLQKVEEKFEHIIEEEKVFRKVSDNICALQEKETKFQNYGLVDYIPRDTLSKLDRNFDTEEKLSSYLDVEIGDKRSHRSLASTSKDRPVSWTNEMNERLQKKRQMHDSATNKPMTENKENSMWNTGKTAKTTCAKNTKSKKFFLFR